jgi:hypothetical protein
MKTQIDDNALFFTKNPKYTALQTVEVPNEADGASTVNLVVPPSTSN